MRHRPNMRRAFTMIELLLVVAITSILLAAVAMAFNAQAFNLRQNEQMLKTLNQARQAMLRLTTQLRTADFVDPDTAAGSCRLITADGEDLTYSYNAGDRKLYLTTNDDLSDPDYVLCDNVASATFQKTTFVDGGQTKVKYVRITATVSLGDTQQTVHAAAAIRRNLK
ncbi:MAG TPA: type II secretion system protein [Phycisphaerales bacterium]|nr:type II secretion system protein [Phycisphaerales bacterium]